MVLGIVSWISRRPHCYLSWQRAGGGRRLRVKMRGIGDSAEHAGGSVPPALCAQLLELAAAAFTPPSRPLRTPSRRAALSCPSLPRSSPLPHSPAPHCPLVPPPRPAPALQEEERERRMDFIPDESAINTEAIEVDKDTMDMLKAISMAGLPGVTVQQVGAGGGAEQGGPCAGRRVERAGESAGRRLEGAPG